MEIFNKSQTMAALFQRADRLEQGFLIIANRLQHQAVAVVRPRVARIEADGLFVGVDPGFGFAPMGEGRETKWIANYDRKFKGPIPVRQALAESRNAVAVWITREIGLSQVIRTARELGIRTPLQPYVIRTGSFNMNSTVRQQRRSSSSEANGWKKPAWRVLGGPGR